MCVEREGGRKRGEAGARQGSRMGVLIKKTQIAAQQMIFSRHKTVVGGDKDAWDICEPRCRTYHATASAGETAQVVIISSAASQREDVNVWETHQFFVPSILLMWFWRCISRSITCSLDSETTAQSTWTSAYPDQLAVAHTLPLANILYSGGLAYFLWCTCFPTLLQ